MKTIITTRKKRIAKEIINRKSPLVIKLFLILSLILILISSLILTGCGEKDYTDAEKIALAQCLNDKGVKMYGTEWCTHCQAQKKAFGEAFQLVNFIDCDKNRDECISAGVNKFPTWIINGNFYLGQQSFSKLASLAGCEN